MGKIIRQRKYVDGPHIRERFYEWEDTPNAGFAFECDAEGNVNTNVLQPAGLESYRRCKDGSMRSRYGEKVIDRGIREYQLKGHWEDAILKCDCGREVYLSGFTNTCDCGRDYNMSGQELASRSQWGEETSEYLSDILRIK